MADTLQFSRVAFLPEAGIYRRDAKPLTIPWWRRGLDSYASVGTIVLANLLMPAVCLTIAGVLNRFSTRESTAAKRGWTLSWFIIGNIFGVLVEVGVLRIVSVVISFAFESDEERVTRGP